MLFVLSLCCLHAVCMLKLMKLVAERRRRRAALAEHYAAKEQQKAAEAGAIYTKMRTLHQK